MAAFFLMTVACAASSGFLGHAVLLAELLDAARSVNKFHLTCEEWVAIGTYFHHDVLLGATGYKLVTTTASNRCLGILGVNTILHVTFSIGWQR